jgi:hypothetical protein
MVLIPKKDVGENFNNTIELINSRIARVTCPKENGKMIFSKSIIPFMESMSGVKKIRYSIYIM